MRYKCYSTLELVGGLMDGWTQSNKVFPSLLATLSETFTVNILYPANIDNTLLIS